MKVLVTGGAGYIGSAVCDLLLKERHEVVVLDNLQQGNPAKASPGVLLVVSSLLYKEDLSKLFRDHQFDAVIHMAASVSLGESNRDPRGYYSNNVVASLNLLDEMVKCEVDKIIFSSSGAVYGDTKCVPARESSPKHPTSCYGQTKLVVEEVLRQYEHSYGLKHVSLRYNCVAGATPTHGSSKKSGNGLIPTILEVALGTRDKLFIHGIDYPTIDGTGVRSYVHLLDVARANIIALSKIEELSGSIYNISDTKAYSVLEIVGVAEAVTRKRINIKYTDRRRGDAGTVVLDVDRAKGELGWCPENSNIVNITRTAWEWMNA